MEGWDPLFMDGPVQDAAGAQHAPAEEERPRQLVVVDVLEEDQDHGVPAGFDHLVESLMSREPEEAREDDSTSLKTHRPSESASHLPATPGIPEESFRDDEQDLPGVPHVVDDGFQLRHSDV